MVKPIIRDDYSNFQLISKSIELVHKILAVTECGDLVGKNPHLDKACKLAQEWNQDFINIYFSKEAK